MTWPCLEKLKEYKYLTTTIEHGVLRAGRSVLPKPVPFGAKEVNGDFLLQVEQERCNLRVSNYHSIRSIYFLVKDGVVERLGFYTLEALLAMSLIFMGKGIAFIYLML